MLPRDVVDRSQPGPQWWHRGGNELPERFSRIRFDAPVPCLELALVGGAEQAPDMLLVRPLARIRLDRERPSGLRVLLRPSVSGPDSECAPSTTATDPTELGSRALVVQS